MVSLAKLWFLTPKHALARVKAGGQSYEELLELLVKAARDFCNHHESEKLPIAHESSDRMRAYFDRILKSDAKNYKTAMEFIKTHSYFLLKHPETVEMVDVDDASMARIRDHCLDGLGRLTGANWEVEELTQIMKSIMKCLTEGMRKDEAKALRPKIWKVLRGFLTGGEHGPTLVETMDILGQKVVLERIKSFKL